MALRMDDGTEREFGPGDTFHTPPGAAALIENGAKLRLLSGRAIPPLDVADTPASSGVGGAPQAVEFTDAVDEEEPRRLASPFLGSERRGSYDRGPHDVTHRGLGSCRLAGQRQRRITAPSRPMQRSGLAGIQLAPAPPSAGKQGRRPLVHASGSSTTRLVARLANLGSLVGRTGRPCLRVRAGQGVGSPSRSSVRYFGASAIAFAMNAPVAASSSGGGVSVRCATGTPTSLKNSSCPAGEQRHKSRAGRSETFRKTCGALAGTLIVSPAVATALTPRNVSSIS